MSEHVSQIRQREGKDPYAEGNWISNPSAEDLALADAVARQRMGTGDLGYVRRRASRRDTTVPVRLRGAQTGAAPVVPRGVEIKPPTRAQLDKKAVRLGLDPRDYSNLREVALAIDAAESKLASKKK